MAMKKGRQGVLLAAGYATRLGLKGLLPQRRKHWGPLIMDSGLRLLLENCDDALILDTPYGLLQNLNVFPGGGGRIITDPRSQGGILEAISVGAANSTYPEIMVAHWDNIYPRKESYPRILRNVAVVREVPIRWTKRLDGQKAGTWLHRGNDATMALTTPWFFPRETALAATKYHTLIDFLNGESIASLEMDLDNWCDIGTEEAYIAYIQNRTT